MRRSPGSTARGSRAPERPQAPRLQVVPRADRAAVLPGGRGDRRPERVGQVQHLGLAPVGDGSGRAEHPPGERRHRRAVRRHGRASRGGRVRGRARARQLGRRVRAPARRDLGDAPPAPRRRVRVPAGSACRAPSRGAGGACGRGPRTRSPLRDLAGKRRRGAARPSRGAPRADRGGRRSRQVPAAPSTSQGTTRPRPRRSRACRRYRA